MKKLPIILLLLSLLLNSLAFTYWDSDSPWYKKYYITAYYSPLPDQKYYLRGNYEDEIKLNWEWIRWASWKEVYPWMIAAPKTYAFWTKIYFEWLWVWTVDDRGWAIVWSWSRWYDGDRIDIWMWYWDDWLKRALTWWKRTIYWKILSTSESVEYNQIVLDSFKIWKINVWSLKNSSYVWKETQVTVDSIFPSSVTSKSSKDDIVKIQNILTDLWFYKEEIDWIYDSWLIDSIADFQLSNSIIKSNKDNWTWWYWPKTKEIISLKYNEFLENKKKIEEEKLAFEKKSKELENKVLSLIGDLWYPKKNEIWTHVRKLQKTLKLLGYFDYKDTAILWDKTIESINLYKKSKGIQISEVVLDEDTKLSLKEDLIEKLKIDEKLLSNI